ncbi:hypothetical protein [Streptomyces mirabilis]
MYGRAGHPRRRHLASIPGQFGYGQADLPLPAPSQFSGNIAFSVTSVITR